MSDYSRYRTETLRKMREKAYEKYYAEAVKPVGNWGDGMRRSKLHGIAAYEKALARLSEIDTELGRRVTYRFMYCKTLNPLGETGEVECETLRDAILFCVNFRNKDCEKTSAGYSVYSVDEHGGIRETLLNWQHDGKNIFGRLVDPENPACYFSA